LITEKKKEKKRKKRAFFRRGFYPAHRKRAEQTRKRLESKAKESKGKGRGIQDKTLRATKRKEGVKGKDREKTQRCETDVKSDVIRVKVEDLKDPDVLLKGLEGATKTFGETLQGLCGGFLLARREIEGDTSRVIELRAKGRSDHGLGIDINRTRFIVKDDKLTDIMNTTKINGFEPFDLSLLFPRDRKVGDRGETL